MVMELPVLHHCLASVSLLVIQHYLLEQILVVGLVVVVVAVDFVVVVAAAAFPCHLLYYELMNQLLLYEPYG